MKQININDYKRITKRTAERLYEAGHPVLFCPVKLIPGGVWNNGCIITQKEGRTFKQELNAFEYYNCSNATGNYTAFYVKAERIAE
jgi:hypothetical protein